MPELVVEPAGVEYLLGIAKAVSEMATHETEFATYAISRIYITIDGGTSGLSLVANEDGTGLDVAFRAS